MSTPILVAVHGRNDVIEPLRQTWERIVRGRGLVVCPRGIDAGPGRYTFESPAALAAEIDRDLEGALGPFVYAGFSLGAFFGVRVVAAAPTKFPRVVLIEGGHDPWDDATLAAFARGGERVLFVSGQLENHDRSLEIAARLRAVGVEARTAYAERAGHVYTGAMERLLVDGFEWLIANDPRWA